MSHPPEPAPAAPPAPPAPRAVGGPRVPLAALAVTGWLLALAALVILGADLLWVVALGDEVRRTGAVPDGIPFAAAPQAGWPNPVVLAELLLSVVHGLGPLALAALQLVLVAATLLVVVAEGRRLGAGEGRTALVVSLVVVGASAALVVTRLPSLSLVPFVLALALMRRQHERPSRALWWLVPLFVLWGNLHGAVLVGLAVLGVFLVASRGGGPLLRRLGVGVGCALALVLTSAGLRTPEYYLGALSNEAAARGTDLWARPDPTHPLDAAMLLALVVLLALVARRRPPVWEWLVVAGLALGTVQAARNGVWLVLFLAPAALRTRRAMPVAASGIAPSATRGHRAVTALAAVAAVVGCAVLLGARGTEAGAPGADVVAAVRSEAAGRVVLADEPLAETLAQGGVRVWAANPVDAFTREAQGSFLDFLHDAAVPADPAIALVVVDTDRAAAVTGRGWRELRRVGGYTLLTR